MSLKILLFLAKVFLDVPPFFWPVLLFRIRYFRSSCPSVPVIPMYSFEFFRQLLSFRRIRFFYVLTHGQITTSVALNHSRFFVVPYAYVAFLADVVFHISPFLYSSHSTHGFFKVFGSLAQTDRHFSYLTQSYFRISVSDLIIRRTLRLS